MLKRIGLFLLTNIAVLVIFSIILSVLNYYGIDLYGNSIGQIVGYAFIFGMIASLFSLSISRWSAIRAFGIEEVTGGTLYDKVAEIAKRANIPMPMVGIYHSDDINAFATGPSKKRSLVAVSSKALSLNSDELEGILAHEISHIKNGDMVTLALIQGVVNAFVIVASRLTLNVIKDKLGDSIGTLLQNVVYILLQIVFGILASTIVMYFSRKREYRADEGSAKLVGKEKMIKALERLKTETEELDKKEYAMMAIHGARKESIFSSHPSLEKRIEHLKKLRFYKNLIK